MGQPLLALSGWFPTHVVRCANAKDGAPDFVAGKEKARRGMGSLDGRLEMD